MKNVWYTMYHFPYDRAEIFAYHSRHVDIFAIYIDVVYNYQEIYICTFRKHFLSLSPSLTPSIAQLIKASDVACTGRYPVQALAMFLNELSISFSLLSLSLSLLFSFFSRSQWNNVYQMV